ncbi:MAG: Gfo/Idh/MocA family oxidoreductase [Planctomycetaceae bacterium]|nr:Gfo/Idh/MocA family oxidoreductase [Planctomycetaceae bacterium]
MNRREFIKQSVLGTAAVSVPYFFTGVQSVQAQAPSDRLRMGLIGCGGRGRYDASISNGLTDIVAVSDVDSNFLEAAQQSGLGKKGADGKAIPPEAYKDYRKLLDRKDIDCIIVGTPDHWHTKITIEAIQAGKHVFVEKPLTLTIEENQLIREACKKYKKIVQVGSQRRCDRDTFMVAIMMCWKGMLGDIKRIVCDLGPGRTSGSIPKTEVPEALDYDMWLGQAPVADYLASKEMVGTGKTARPQYGRSHGEFRGWYEYNGGKFTDFGAHFIDSVMLALNEAGPGQGPTLIKPLMAEHNVPFKDGYPTIADRYNTACKFQIECHFPSGVVMDVCSQSPDGVGILFEGTKGKIHVNLERIKGKPYEIIGGAARENGHAKPYPELPELQKNLTLDDYARFYKGKKIESHMQNFITCMREGGEPVSDVDSTVQVMHVCHLLGIAARLNKEITWNPKTEKTGDAESMKFLAREQRKGYENPTLT